MILGHRLNLNDHQHNLLLKFFKKILHEFQHALARSVLINICKSFPFDFVAVVQYIECMIILLKQTCDVISTTQMWL